MNHVRTRTFLALVWGAGTALACSSGAINIGNTGAVGSQLSDYAASWDGYAEAYTFSPDGSDRVRLTIAASGQGTLEVGNQPLVPPPTDANVGYPPGVNYLQAYPTSNFPPLWEGFAYPVYNPQVQGDRIQVGLTPNDYFAAWCGLQTPFGYVIQRTLVDAGGADAGGSYVLTPVAVDGGSPDASGVMYTACPLAIFGAGAGMNGGVTTCYGDGKFNGDPTQIDCGKFSLCLANVCACTASSCGSSPLVAAGSLPSQYPVELDAALENNGQTLTGTLALSSTLRLTVVLTKQ